MAELDLCLPPEVPRVEAGLIDPTASPKRPRPDEGAIWRPEREDELAATIYAFPEDLSSWDLEAPPSPPGRAAELFVAACVVRAFASFSTEWHELLGLRADVNLGFLREWTAPCSPSECPMPPYEGEDRNDLLDDELLGMVWEHLERVVESQRTVHADPTDERERTLYRARVSALAAFVATVV